MEFVLIIFSLLAGGLLVENCVYDMDSIVERYSKKFCIEKKIGNEKIKKCYRIIEVKDE